MCFHIGGHSSYFVIDSTTGQIVSQSKFDYDAAGVIQLFDQLQLSVVDSNVNTIASPQALTVTLQDINDNAPKCSPAFYAATIAENSNAGK